MRTVYVETVIDAQADLLWHLTQDPTSHARWDLRFTRITPLADGPEEAESPSRVAARFRYATRVLPWVWLDGVGIHAGERRRPDGSATSVLRFYPSSRLSPLGEGSGYWRYVPTPDGVRFLTGYDYRPGWGRVPDRLVRPLLGWATAWSFDRLRLWAERGITPEQALVAGVVDLLARVVLLGAAIAAGPLAVIVAGALMLPPTPLVPAARRCRRRPPERLRIPATVAGEARR